MYDRRGTEKNMKKTSNLKYEQYSALRQVYQKQKFIMFIAAVQV